MSINTRPATKITIGETYYELIDNYAVLVTTIQNLEPDDLVEVARWDNGKKMTIRVGSIDTIQEAGY